VAAALRTATGRGSTVPVHELGTARPLAREVPESGMVGSHEQAGQGFGRDCSGSAVEALSQRREFRGAMAAGVSPAFLMEGPGLWMSTCRGQKGRQVVDGDRRTGQHQLPRDATRSPRPGTQEMAGIADELMCMGLAGLVSSRFPTQAARRYSGPESPAGRRGSRRRLGRRGRRGRRNQGRHRKEGHGLSRDTGQGDMAGAQRAGYQSFLDCSDLDSGTRMEGPGRGDEAASLMSAGERDRAVCPSAPRDSASWRSLPGLVEWWGTRVTNKKHVTPGRLREDLGAEAGIPPAVLGAVTTLQGRYGGHQQDRRGVLDSRKFCRYQTTWRHGWQAAGGRCPSRSGEN
jgi:hypothetical protein